MAKFALMKDAVRQWIIACCTLGGHLPLPKNRHGNASVEVSGGNFPPSVQHRDFHATGITLSPDSEELVESNADPSHVPLPDSPPESVRSSASMGSRSMGNLAAGRVTPVATKLEVEKGSQLINIYVCEVPVRDTSGVMKVLQKISQPTDPKLQHIRRIAKQNDYPGFLRAWSPSCKDRHSKEMQYIYIGIASVMERDQLIAELSHAPIFTRSPAPVLVIPAPQYPPSSLEQAKEWSEQYWPVNYQCSNLFGPNPRALQNATIALEKKSSANRWMTLAFDVAKEAAPLAQGYEVGTVIVERHKNGVERAVCVAADARWHSTHSCAADDPAAHSVMRAIAMAAKKNRARSDKHTITSPESSEDDDSRDMLGELTNLEHKYLIATDTLTDRSEKGYLCLNLHVFTTHEPCVMCSMALVHSRIFGLVFAKPMSRTGGIVFDRRNPRDSASDSLRDITNCYASHDIKASPKKEKSIPADSDGARYGLFWRADLNWRFMAWQWRQHRGRGLHRAKDLPDDVHA